MTPAIDLLKQHRINHRILEYGHAHSPIPKNETVNQAYGVQAAAKLGLDETLVFKTLIVKLDDHDLVVAVIPVNAMLSMKLIARALNGKKAVMATQAQAERSSGYVLGGISPLAQKKWLKTVIDSSAMKLAAIYVSAGRRGLEIEVAPDDLGQLTQAVFAHLTQ
ncbi:MAG: Cys-tRNA(Pro)/Cys-tRNA(Cys) deacylase [Candidatus Pseudothioglobus sp.]|jgi:Cys-tRNA(Pro)/Cys-tRNA(Cys) deacylase